MKDTQSKVEKILWESLMIPSFTGNEENLANYFYDLFKTNGFNVSKIQHTEKRSSIIATYGEPKCAFCTHLDTAIEWKKPSKIENKIYGIGACDAKGALACQSYVALNLVKQKKSIAIAFLAGEESDSVGAKYLLNNSILPVEYIIHGEPTNTEFISRTGSVIELEIIVKGEQGHSSCKNNDISAIHNLLKFLSDIEITCSKNDLTFHIGNINGGGVAPGSFPNKSTALIQVRGYKDSEEVLNMFEKLCPENISLEIIYLNNYCKLITLPNYKSKDVLFGSDAGVLQSKYKQLLVGPGDIIRDHREDEFITMEELSRGIKCYEDAYNFLNIEDING